jgi:glycerol-3-phosphate dehydrogenase subunit C
MSIDTCTTCSTCVTACPVSRVTRRYNGPKLTGPSSQRFRLLSKEEIDALDYCTNCKNCDIACPNNVQISTLNMLARAEWCRRHKPPLRDWMLSHGSRMAKLARKFPYSLVKFGVKNPLTRLALDKVGIDRRAPMPVFARQSFMEQFARLVQEPNHKKIVFFPGCFINDYEPQVGLDTVWLLNRAGYEVIVPTDRCCGVPLVANGFYDEAKAAATAVCASLASYAEKGIPVIAACTSCSLMLRQEYGELFEGVDGIDALRESVRDAGEFLRDLADCGAFVLPPNGQGQTYVYHEPCHLRVQGLGKPAVDLLRRTGMKIIDAGADCCGISGSYGFKKGKYEVGAAIGAQLFASVDAAIESGAAAALCECGTCRIQIGGHTKAQVRHPLSILRGLMEKAQA